MRITKRNQIVIFLIFLSTLLNDAKAQSISYTPGPANMDTSKFAPIYFFRDKEDEFPDNWIGVTINDDQGICVKAKMKHIYRVNTVLSGNTKFQTKINEFKEEITLNLSPGKNYYIELRPERINEEKTIAKLILLDDEEGLSRIRLYTNKVQDRYCILPFNGDHDFRENAYDDTMRWYASKNYHYYFNPLPSWELILRSKPLTVLGFRNKLISTTYSENGGILYQPLSKCKSELDFEMFCKGKFIESTLTPKQDSIISYEVKSVVIPDGIKYAKIVTTEIKNRTIDLSQDQPLLIRSTYVVFFWTDEKGKGYSACLYTSERGLRNELHTISTLEERLLWSWQSFSLVKNKNNK